VRTFPWIIRFFINLQYVPVSF